MQQHSVSGFNMEWASETELAMLQRLPWPEVHVLLDALKPRDAFVRQFTSGIDCTCIRLSGSNVRALVYRPGTTITRRLMLVGGPNSNNALHSNISKLGGFAHRPA